MHKKNITVLLLIIMMAQGLPAVSRFNIHSIGLFGYEPVSRYENKVTGPGLSLAQEFYYSRGSLISFGAGCRYLFPVETVDNEELSFTAVYAALKVFFTDKTVPLYAKAAAGYNFIEGNEDVELSKNNLKGGFYYSLGGGIDLPLYYTDFLRFSLVLDMGWSSYSAGFESSGGNESLSYITLDMLAGLGIRL